MTRPFVQFDAPTRRLYFGNHARCLHEYSANALPSERINWERVALTLALATASKSRTNSLSARGTAAGSFGKPASKRWRQLERVAQALRSLSKTPMTQARTGRMAQRVGVHWATIYRLRLDEIDEVTAFAGRTLISASNSDDSVCEPTANRRALAVKDFVLGLTAGQRTVTSLPTRLH